MAIKINDIRELLSKGGGIASSNTYKVSFEFNEKRTPNNKLKEKLGRVFDGFNKSHFVGDTIGSGKEGHYISLLCDEVSLPGTQTATGQINGMYTGSGQYNYAHTRLFNDLTLSWICDANMTPMKFIQTWMETIFIENTDTTSYQTINQIDPGDVLQRSRNRSVRLNYFDDYSLQLSILKAEKDNQSELGRPSIRYVLEGVFPYSIDSTPLSFGSSQLVKVSANFYYERWYTYYTKQWNNKGPFV